MKITTLWCHIQVGTGLKPNLLLILACLLKNLYISGSCIKLITSGTLAFMYGYVSMSIEFIFGKLQFKEIPHIFMKWKPDKLQRTLQLCNISDGHLIQRCWLKWTLQAVRRLGLVRRVLQHSLLWETLSRSVATRRGSKCYNEDTENGLRQCYLWVMQIDPRLMMSQHSNHRAHVHVPCFLDEWKGIGRRLQVLVGQNWSPLSSAFTLISELGDSDHQYKSVSSS